MTPSFSKRMEFLPLERPLGAISKFHLKKQSVPSQWWQCSSVRGVDYTSKRRISSSRLRRSWRILCELPKWRVMPWPTNYTVHGVWSVHCVRRIGYLMGWNPQRKEREDNCSTHRQIGFHDHRFVVGHIDDRWRERKLRQNLWAACSCTDNKFQFNEQRVSNEGEYGRGTIWNSHNFRRAFSTHHKQPIYLGRLAYAMADPNWMTQNEKKNLSSIFIFLQIAEDSA